MTGVYTEILWFDTETIAAITDLRAGKPPVIRSDATGIPSDRAPAQARPVSLVLSGESGDFVAHGLEHGSRGG